jgi:hypothetical protein
MTLAPKRRWFRFSLRTLFVVVTVAGVFLWYFRPWEPLLLRAYGISNSDFSTFSTLIATDQRINCKHIVKGTVVANGQVEVTTGDPSNPAIQGKQNVSLRKINGGWTITNIRDCEE